MDFYKKSEFYIFCFIISASIIVILFFLNISYIGINSSIYLNISLYILLFDFILLLIYYYIRYRSVEHYKKCIEEFKKMQNMDSIILSERFPERDEFGDLGKHLNYFMKILKKFDDLKKERIFLEKKKVKFFIDMINQPIIIIDNEGYIIDYNNSFYESIKRKGEKFFKGIKIFTFFTENFENKFNQFKEEDLEQITIENEIIEIDNGESDKENKIKFEINIKLLRIVSTYLVVGEENFERLEEYILFIDFLNELK
ncbi:MAG: hypothetical protein N3A58_05625 [Spirochaetes bacterium]|nr:hypothetical protein [Spirochaetota bacterium]